MNGSEMLQKSPNCANPLEQTSHLYGFSPVWVRLWIANLARNKE